MREINLTKVDVQKNEIKFIFEGLKDIHVGNSLLIKYKFDVTSYVTNNMLVNMFFAMTLPLAASSKRETEVVVDSCIPVDESTVVFWNRLINEVHGLNNCVIRANNIKEDSEEIYSSSKPSRVGIFYGGGVEGNYTLAGFVAHKPVLVNYEGPKLMNSYPTVDGRSAKRELLKKVCKDFDLDEEIIDVPIFASTKRNKNRILESITATTFFYCAMPVAKKYNISLFFWGQEQEDLRQFQSRYSPERFPGAHLINQFRIKNGPLVKNFGGYAYKPALLHTLLFLHPEFCKYIYSCICNNPNKRWCDCHKCRRMISYFDAFGWDREMLEIDDSLQGTKWKDRYQTGLNRMRKELDSVKNIALKKRKIKK